MDFGLIRVGKGEEVDIPGEGRRLQYVKKIGISNQYQTEKSLLSKERIRPTLPTPWKALPKNRYKLAKWKYLQG